MAPCDNYTSVSFASARILRFFRARGKSSISIRIFTEDDGVCHECFLSSAVERYFSKVQVGSSKLSGSIFCFLGLNPHEKDCDAQVDDMSYVKVIPSNLDTLLYINQSCLEDGACQVLSTGGELWGDLPSRTPT